MNYYKVLPPNMRSSENAWEPGVWYSTAHGVWAGKRGFQATNAPYATWWQWGCLVWNTEQRGDMDSKFDLRASAEMKITTIEPHPQWLQDAVHFVDSIKDVKFERSLPPAPGQYASKHPNQPIAFSAALNAGRDAARGVRSAAWNGAYSAARAAAWSAVRAVPRDDIEWKNAAQRVGLRLSHDAALMATTLVVADLLLDPVHVEYAKRRWQEWQT